MTYPDAFEKAWSYDGPEHLREAAKHEAYLGWMLASEIIRTGLRADAIPAGAMQAGAIPAAATRAGVRTAAGFGNEGMAFTALTITEETFQRMLGELVAALRVDVASEVNWVAEEDPPSDLGLDGHFNIESALRRAVTTTGLMISRKGSA